MLPSDATHDVRKTPAYKTQQLRTDGPSRPTHPAAPLSKGTSTINTMPFPGLTLDRHALSQGGVMGRGTQASPLLYIQAG
jgi:hypothetical protein